MNGQTREQTLILQADRLDARLSHSQDERDRVSQIRQRNEARYWRRIAAYPEAADQLGYHRFDPNSGLYLGIVYPEDEED